MIKTRLLKFLLIAFLITYFCWGGLALFVKLGFFTFTHPFGTLMHIVGGFGPFIAYLTIAKDRFTLKSFTLQTFKSDPKTTKYFWVFAIIESLTFGISSMELNSSMPLYFIPIVFVGTVIIFGGNEEYGWRGVMQPILEKKLPYPVATLITGIVWSVWHLPLWFVDGSSQQSIPFLLFAVLAIFLSFFFSAIYKKTKSMFYCCILHGLTNTLMSVFVVKVNVILIIGLVILLGYSFYLWYSTTDSNQVER